MSTNRDKALVDWVTKTLALKSVELAPISGDASFRRYFRLDTPKRSLIVVDSPPATENNQAFVTIGQQLEKQKLNVPSFLHFEQEQGFMILSDLGDTLFLGAITEENIDTMYRAAIEALFKIQQIPLTSTPYLPVYDAQLLQFEMSLFRDWFIDKHLAIELTSEQHQVIETTIDRLTINALEQPQVFVHRDFHSRNLMVLENNELAVIDFQDALKGPLSYDLVSLLKDCYIKLPTDKVKSLCFDYWQRANQSGELLTTFEAFFKQFEWMGMQRHIKVLGIFCRLFYRDEKSNYLKDLPLTLEYLMETSSRYDELSEFSMLLAQTVKPALAQKVT